MISIAATDFFVYVYERLVNVDDGHFGISPNVLKHGIFGRFRLVIHMDGLDEGLRSNRETVAEGTLRGHGAEYTPSHLQCSASHDRGAPT